MQCLHMSVHTMYACIYMFMYWYELCQTIAILNKLITAIGSD